MPAARRRGKINVKLVVIIVCVVVLLGVGAIVARHVRRSILAARDLAAGTAAYEKEDWATACKHFQEYLGRRPENADILGKYAASLLSREPLEPRSIARAAWAYRQLLNVRPGEEAIYKKLATLYTHTRNLSELSYIAKRRLEQAPEDAQAEIWLARALIGQQKLDQARKKLAAVTERLKKHPDKPPEYVEASLLLSRIALRKEDDQGRTEALQWLDLAIQYDPENHRAILDRARFYRDAPPFGGRTKEAMRKQAAEDLERVEALKTDDPVVALTLSEEWMHHGDLARAQRWLDSVGEVDRAALKKHFVDPNEWVIARFVQAAELAVRRGKAAEAEGEAEKVLERIEGRHQRLVVLASAVRLYLAGGRVDQARKRLDEFLELLKLVAGEGGTFREPVLLKALVAAAENRPDEVIRVLEPLAARDDATPLMLGLLAQAYAQTNQRLRSIRTLQRYTGREAKDAGVWLLLARQLMGGRQWQKAAEAARKAESLAADKLEAKLLRIEAAIHAAAEALPVEKESLDGPADELAGLKKDRPDDARLWALQAKVEVARGRLEGAEQVLRQAVRKCGEMVDLELQLAAVLADRNRRADALEVCRRACERHPDSRRAWGTLAGLHQAARDRDKARAALERGLQAVAEADRPALGRDLAVLELLQGDREAGLKRLRELARQDPADVRSRSLLLGLPEVLGDTKLAERLLEEIRQVRGERSQLWRRHRGRLWLVGDEWRKKRHEIAKTLEAWMTQEPRWPFPALMLATLHQRLGRASEAERACRRALSLNPGAVEVADFLVALLTRQNRHAEGAKVLEALEAAAVPSRSVSALRFRVSVAADDLDRPIEDLTLQAAGNPRDVAARLLLARLVYQRGRDVKRAMRHLDEAAAIRPESIAVAATRAAILKAEGKTAEAVKVLDEQIARAKSFAAYLLRARFLESVGRHGDAEQDYRRLTTLEPRRDGWRLLAAFYESRGRAHEAVAVLEKALEAVGEDATLQAQLMLTLLRRNGKGDLLGAEKILAGLEGRVGENADLLYARAALLLGQGGRHALRKARAALERVVEIEPSGVRGYLALIEIATQNQDYRQARALAVRGLEASPNHPRLLLAQARAERAMDDTEGAARLAREALRHNPAGSDAIRFLASMAVQSKKAEALSEALRLARQAGRARPEDHTLPLTAAVILEAMGKREDSLAELETYAKTPAGRRSIPVLLALARACQRLGKADAADRWLRQAEGVNARDATVLIERLRWLEAQKKLDEIVSRMAAYGQGKELEATVFTVAAAILVSSPSATHRQEALKLSEQALAVTPNPAAGRVDLAGIAISIGQVDRAEALYREVLKDEPDNPHALNGLAWTLATGRKDYQAALPLADRAIKLAPRSSHAHDTRAVILFHLGRLADARKEFEACVELTAPHSARRAKTLLQLGRTCQRLQDAASARKHLQDALRIDKEIGALTGEQRREIADILEALSVGPRPHQPGAPVVKRGEGTR